METIAYTVSGTTTEIGLTALGVGTALSVEFATHGASKFRLPLPGVPPETAPAIPFEAQCKIYTGRTYSGGSWTGGTLLFQGRRTDNHGEVSGTAVNSEIVIEDVWYDFRNLTLQAVWQVITGGTMASPTYGTAASPDCVLFQATPGVNYATWLSSPNPAGLNTAAVTGHITTGQAIVEMLQYAINYGGVNLQIGEIDPALYVPFYPVRSERIDQCLKYALRVHPDCTCEIDHTTTPPTFNIRQRSNLTALTLPYAGSQTASGRAQTHLTSSITPRPDLVPSRVCLTLKETSQVAGQAVISMATDLWPAAAPIALRSFDASLDLTGPRISYVTGQVTTYAGGSATAAINGTESTALAWWKLKVPAFGALETVPGSVSLVNTAINDGSLNCITVLDDTGATVNLMTYNTILEHGGTIHPWMSVPKIECTVTGYFTYQRRKNLGTAASPVWVITKEPNQHAHPVRVTLCTAPQGVTQYEQEQILSTGEGYPGGLAEGIYNALSALQYQFKHTILEQPFGTIIKPGKHALNVTGGATAWQTMNAMVQSVRIKLINSPTAGITSAETTVSCGPIAHLEPGQIIQLFNIFQNRDLSRINPNERSSGLPNGGANAGMPSQTAKENTSPTPADEAQQMYSAPDAVTANLTPGFFFDPANHQILFQQFNTISGTPGTPVFTGAVKPTYTGTGAPSATTLPALAYFPLLVRYIDTSVTPQQEYICTTAGTNSTSVWTQLGGAASVDIQMFAITALGGGDTFAAKAWSGSGSLGATVTIAKTPRARATVTSELIDGDAMAYTPITTNSYDPYGDNNRLATDSSGSEPQVCYPRYVTLGQLGLTTPVTPSTAYAGNECQAIVFAFKPSNGTGMTGVLWQELNQRVWIRKYGS